MKTKVVIAMSGGVDSSVSAALLKEQGYDVVGMMLRLWSEPGAEQHNRCCTPDSMALARRVAALLEIPFYAVDARQPFRETVVEYFIEGYTQGITPNPCLVCNRSIRWGLLLEHALGLGADYLATGHYARLKRQQEQPIRLFRAVDSNKDQSYVLGVLNQEQLQRTLLPIGDYPKEEVRNLARHFNLPAAEVKDSQDLCFLAGQSTASFLQRLTPEIAQPGTIVNTAGEVLGEHQGLAYYTVGQRKGLGIAAAQPIYVLAKDTATNTLVVGGRDELGDNELTAIQVNWISGAPPIAPFQGEVKIRYKADPAQATITPLEGRRAHVKFANLLRAITPGQGAVFYNGDEVLGAGIIV